MFSNHWCRPSKAHYYFVEVSSVQFVTGSIKHLILWAVRMVRRCGFISAVRAKSVNIIVAKWNQVIVILGVLEAQICHDCAEHRVTRTGKRQISHQSIIESSSCILTRCALGDWRASAVLRNIHGNTWLFSSVVWNEKHLEVLHEHSTKNDVRRLILFVRFQFLHIDITSVGSFVVLCKRQKRHTYVVGATT